MRCQFLFLFLIPTTKKQQSYVKKLPRWHWMICCNGSIAATTTKTPQVMAITVMLSVERSVALRIPPNDGPDRRESKIAIFDVTNSTKELRDMITRTCKDHCNKSGTPPIGIIFIETICDDKELLEENYLYKIRNSPDFEGLSEEQAMADLRMRAAKYEEGYKTIDDDSLLYVKYLIFPPRF